MIKRKILLLLTLVLFNTSALAEKWYVDGGLGIMNFDDGVDTVSPTNIYIRGGYILTENFNIGIESNVTISPDQLFGVDFSVDVGTIFVRGVIPTGENIQLYVQLGFSNTTLTGEAGGVSVSVDDDDTMIGFGADIDIGDKSMYVALNYSSYNRNDGADASAVNIGIGTRF